MNQPLLIVEDDPGIAETLAQLLVHHGHRVLLAHDGQEALDLIARHRPALVICDINLPTVDGWTVCRIVKRHPLTQRTPFVLLTAAHASREAAEVGLELGADEFIEKPFHGSLLLHAVDRLLHPSPPDVRVA